ncbi:MAG: M2 family metallopeptidase, partial [Deltaproteobacteria bacterium]|nr:M2 family metallopeptidase [Deltaproteobacteria bacterium]
MSTLSRALRLTPALAAVIVLACASPQTPPPGTIPPTKGPPKALSGTPTQARATGPTVEEAEAFLARAEKKLLVHMIRAERAGWIKSTNITFDTQAAAAHEEAELAALITHLAGKAVRFSKLKLPCALARKFKLLRLSPSLSAPKDATRRAALANEVVFLQSLYGKGRYCPNPKTTALRIKAPRSIHAKGKKRCYHLGQLSSRLAKSRNPTELLEIWKGWHQISRPMRSHYTRYVDLANEGAKALGFDDVGALWKSRFDLEPAAFEKEVDRLWSQVKPLYDQLHCYVRSRLRKKYGSKLVPDGAPIPAHLLGNMWAQDWSHIENLVMPKNARAIDLDKALQKKKLTEEQVVHYAESFFVSLGMDPLPKTFWKRSMLKKPRDRDVVCHASAWDIDFDNDLRIKMCIKINGEDFTTIHHELGHIFYYHYYRHQPTLFRDSANKGFHEGLGDTIALSVTPTYLKKVGILRRVPKQNTIALLLPRALEKVAFLPFGLLIDKWRWDVFAGKVKPKDYTSYWWKLRRHYQGVASPIARTSEDFDPGAKYHIAGNVPYVRYFVAHILQFQFHRALC